MSKIYTKKGDTGKSAIKGRRNVPKSDRCFEILGMLDEVNAHLGMVKCANLHEISGGYEIIAACQSEIMTISAIAAGYPAPLTPELILHMECAIDEMTGNLPPLENFVIPGGNRDACAAHIARAVVRRCERLVCGCDMEIDVIQFFNRLSDFLFTVARCLGPDNIWHPREESKSESNDN